MIKFTGAVGLEVILGSNALLEDLLMRSRSMRNLGFCGLPGRSPFLIVVRFVMDNSVASQSRYSLSIFSGFMLRIAVEDTARTTRVQSVVAGQSVKNVTMSGGCYSRVK